jgi:hypothetical protein
MAKMLANAITLKKGNQSFLKKKIALGTVTKI